MKKTEFCLLDSTLIDTDSYKFSHFATFDSNLTNMASTFVPRTTANMKEEDDFVIFTGLQYLIKNYLSKKVSMAEIDAMRDFATEHGLLFNSNGFLEILNRFEGYLPIEIYALPEGTKVKRGFPLFLVKLSTLSNNLVWLPQYLGTQLERVWYPTTVSTNAFKIKKLLKEFWEESSDLDISSLDFKLHDFGSRGASSRESAMIGGMAHLMVFKGTDTTVGIVAANHSYNSNLITFDLNNNNNKNTDKKFYTYKMYGSSINAAEHSSTISLGLDREFNGFENILNAFLSEDSIFALPIDSYDYFNALENFWCNEETIKKIKENNATIVIRLDSGIPSEIVYKTLQILEKNYGTRTNSKGYKNLLNAKIIYGDGLNEEKIVSILNVVKELKFSIDEIFFGMGGRLLQSVQRDDYNFSYKPCATLRSNYSGETWNPISKNPITDPNKKSKGGFPVITKDNEGELTISYTNSFKTFSSSENLMKKVFDGSSGGTRNFEMEEIRNRIQSYL